MFASSRSGRIGLLIVAFACLTATADRAFADETAAAKLHVKRANTAFYLQRYEEAAKEYEKAFELKDAPGLLFNIGQAYRLSGQLVKALGAYRSYNARVPDAENRAEVVALIADVKNRIEAAKRADEERAAAAAREEAARQAKADADAAAAAAAAAAADRRAAGEPAVVAPAPIVYSSRDIARARLLRRVGLGVTACGVAALVAGGVFAGITSNINGKLNSPAQPSNGGRPIFSKTLEAKGRTDQALETAFFAVGGAAVVAGVATLIVGSKRLKRMTYAVAPAIGPHEVAATLSLRF